MSGEDIPYQLRPNKFIDRQLFMELLARLIVPRGLEKYVYVSMGGRHLIDHHAVYSQLGIEAQYSFDRDANEVKRQKLNRPTGKTICAELDSADLPLKLDEILTEFPSKRNLIVWLDYTGSERRAQFQEAVQTLVRLQDGDVFRITLNASLGSLSGDDEWKKAGAPSPAEHRAVCLRGQIAEYMPINITSISDTEFPATLAQCLELATKAAEAQQPGLKITPALITSYRDGARMLTATLAVSRQGAATVPFPSAAFSRWRYSCGGWNDIQEISVPLLSTRERNRLDARLHAGATKMLDALRFLPSKGRDGSLKALRSYREFHRFYPVFRSVED